MTKTAILGVSRAILSKVMSIYMNHGKTSTEGNSGQKATMTETDRCI
jgi:hypothetical protein